MKDRQLFIVYVPTSELEPNAYNPNVHDADSFDLLVTSLRSFGFTQPIVVDKRTMQIVDGENRWRAACVLGMEDVPVCFVEMTEEERRCATILHNRARGKELGAQIAEIEASLSEDARNRLLHANRK